MEFKEIMVGQDSLRCTFLRECVDTDGIIARIPAALMMPSCRAKSTTVGRKLEERARELGLEPSNHSYLAAWLMYQRSLHLDNEPPTSSPSDNSTKVYYAEDTDQPIGGWGPYICVLPRVYDDPLWWSAEVCFGVLYGDRLEPRNRKREGGSKMRQKAPLCSGALLAKRGAGAASQAVLGSAMLRSATAARPTLVPPLPGALEARRPAKERERRLSSAFGRRRAGQRVTQPAAPPRVPGSAAAAGARAAAGRHAAPRVCARQGGAPRPRPRRPLPGKPTQEGRAGAGCGGRAATSCGGRAVAGDEDEPWRGTRHGRLGRIQRGSLKRGESNVAGRGREQWLPP